MVYPMMGQKLIIEPVAQWLLARKVRSFRLERGFDETKRDAIISKMELGAAPLSEYYPEDLARKYGRALGLDTL
jgi:hypothetical protein